MNARKDQIFKRLLLLSAFALYSLSPLYAQVDTSGAIPLDSLSAEQLLEYYQNEPQDTDVYVGPTIGDSLFRELNKLTMPTSTVAWPQAHRLDEDAVVYVDSADMALQKYKPRISLGMGRLGYHGDIYEKKFQQPMLGRMGYDLAISQRLTRYLQADFSVLFGKLGANERLPGRQENFQSEIRAGGVNLLYDFGNLIPDRYTVRPFVSAGVSGFEFLSKTDLKDSAGNTYYYWSDGSIRNVAEGAPGAQDSRELVRDYKYESDIRELNRDGFGKYAERAWALPLGAGFVMKVTDRLDLKLNFQYWLTTTDYIDGIGAGGTGVRQGNKRNDNFTYTSFALQYDLIRKVRPKARTYRDTLNKEAWLAIALADTDRDGVKDFDDACEGTPAGVKVDEKGCPLDDDGDGIPNYRDDELATAPHAPVNGRGITENEEDWQQWYNRYMNDNTNAFVDVEIVGNIFGQVSGKTVRRKEGKIYTVELVRYSGSIPSDELAFLLSIGDISSTTLEDGTTVVYTSGNYEKLSVAIRRRDEFRDQGNKNAGISTIDGKNIVQLREDELDKLLDAELSQLVNENIADEGSEDEFENNDVVYRVQLGAFKNKISTSIFNTSAGVLELKTGENVYRYVTRGYRTIEDAAAVRADLVIQGYSDAFVTAYRGGKRIPLSETKATVAANFKEDLSEDKMFSSVDKSLIAFKVQLGPLKRKTMEEAMDNKTRVLSSVDKQTTATGSIRYTSGSFTSLAAAEKYRSQLEEKGFHDAFVIATFRDEVVSIQEAQELLK